MVDAIAAGSRGCLYETVTRRLKPPPRTPAFLLPERAGEIAAEAAQSAGSRPS